MLFIPGIQLSQRFYWEAVRPILDAHYPGLPHAAARIGPGSDVLGFDTEMSTDHDWGPSVHIFLRDTDVDLASSIRELLRHELPHVFYGFPVGSVEAPGEPGIRRMQETPTGLVKHRVFLETLRAFVEWQLAYKLGEPLDAADWLTIPSQKLREITAGAVHFDNVGELTALQKDLAYYPHDVWLYLLASGWNRIGQEEHLMPRAGYVADELGSALIGSRLVRDLMTLCFLMERQYAPYPKWFGTAFKHLACSGDLHPILWQAQVAQTWQEREGALVEAYEYLARMHNALGITAKLPEHVAGFHGRPFKVISGSTFAEALRSQIGDPAVKQIASRRLIGSVDQFSDSTDIRSDAAWRPILRNLYA
ncbi:MAG TPA: DUF4037 domain-containing protein [Herpetosiphonaceae bacterium]|nr:DUF4037 domain-containing protein [Herpetosiphonaceae bacterium]